ncbi:MAG: amidohydrolase family protein [Sphingomonas sp.]
MRDLSKFMVVAALGLAWPQAMFAQDAAQPVAIVHGTLITITHGTIENGTLVMTGGRIVAVGGPGTAIPKGAKIIDAKGGTVYPGLFDTENAIGLFEADSEVRAAATNDPAGTPVPWAYIADAVHVTDSVAIERYNGITNSIVAAGTQGPLPGHSASIQLVEDQAKLVIDRDAGLVIDFEGRRDVYPTTVFGIVGYVRQLLTRAHELAAGAVRRDDDATAEAFIPYLGGKKRIIARAVNDTEVGDALDLAHAFDLNLVLVGLNQIDTEIDRVAASGFPVILGRLLDDPQAGRRYDYNFRLPARLAAKGIKVSIGTLGEVAGGPRNLPYAAGVSVAFGFTHDQAMRAITLGPAEAFGLDGQLGSLDIGKVGNVVIADGDPLDVRTQVVQVFIQGAPVSMTNRQTRLRDKYWVK